MVTVAVIIIQISKSQLTDFLLINLSCLVFIDSSVRSCIAQNLFGILIFRIVCGYKKKLKSIFLRSHIKPFSTGNPVVAVYL